MCFGDSGGPGLLDMGQGDRIISVNSTVNGCFGGNCDPCKGTGSNYTRVDTFADWILSVIGETFPKCNDDVSRCDCPAACQADGVCDDIVCVTKSCQSALDCYLNDCDGGADGSCAQACVQGATPEAQTRLGAVMECGADKCLDIVGTAPAKMCLEQNCKTELTSCGAVAGEKSCADAKTCTDACAAGDTACTKACSDAATLDAQAALSKLLACQTSSCAGMTGDPLKTCLGQKCKEGFDACYPPHHCTVGAMSCPAGQECKTTASGSTQCAPSPATPPPSVDAGTPAPPAPTDGGVADAGTPTPTPPGTPGSPTDSGTPSPTDPADGEEDSGTTTTTDPVNPPPGAPLPPADGGGKSSGGCSVRSDDLGNDARVGLALMVMMGVLTVRRRRARSRLTS